MSGKELVRITADIIRETPKAVLVKNVDDADEWIAKSNMHEHDIDGKVITFTIEQWKAERSGLEGDPA